MGYIKFNNNLDNKNSTTVQEHLNVMNKYGVVIWGQSSKRIKNLAKDKIKSINEQISKKGYIYIFFVTCKEANKKRDVYVGKCIQLFNKGEIDVNEIKYVPKYYSKVIGTANDDNIVLFKLNQLVRLDEKILDELYLNSNKNKRVIDVPNMNSLYYVTISDKLEKEISKKDRKNINVLLEDENYHNSDELRTDIIEGSKGKYKVSGSEKFKRDIKRAENAISKAEYKCEVDKNHEIFISNITGKNYVEAHHLIPIKYSDLFNGINIDVEENIISLCVVCHKKLHHGKLNDIIPILTKLYNERKDALERNKN